MIPWSLPPEDPSVEGRWVVAEEDDDPDGIVVTMGRVADVIPVFCVGAGAVPTSRAHVESILLCDWGGDVTGRVSSVGTTTPCIVSPPTLVGVFEATPRKGVE